MKTNADAPISPVVISNQYDNGEFFMDSKHEGLTKREYMAIEFTKAYITCPGNKQPLWVDDNAKQGLLQADALIDALNK